MLGLGGGPTTQKYTIFPIGSGGRAKASAAFVTAENDAEALVEACKIMNGSDIEVWENDRLVAKTECRGRPLVASTFFDPQSLAADRVHSSSVLPG